MRTRLWVGAILVFLAVGVLVLDQWLWPWFPFLFLVVLGAAEAACVEFLGLISPERRPSAWLCYSAVATLVATNWLVHVVPGAQVASGPWAGIAILLAAVVFAALLLEMATFREPGEAVTRVALTLLIACYLGLLPSYLVQLRWLGEEASTSRTLHGTVALALAIFVPKCGDTGAYFTGRFLGRHRMTPILSPKKTWEGAFGGLAASVLTAIAIVQVESPPMLSPLAATAFGVVVGIVAMLGDLAESLIKRDCRQKDASQAIPGFGGVLDVVDSVIFTGPVAYWWLQ